MSIHTFTIGKEPLKKKEFKHIISRLYKLSKTLDTPVQTKKLTNHFHFNIIHGIRIQLSDRVVPRLELKINPAVLLGGSYAELHDFTEATLSQVEDMVNLVLEAIGTDFSFDDMSLSRIDCALDTELPENLLATELIGCIHRTKLGRGYERIQFNHKHKDYHEKNRHSFRAKCRDIALTVYDKSFQLAEEHLMPAEDIPANRLRFEAAFGNASFQRVLNEHLKGTYIDLELGEKIMHFSNLSIQLLRKYFKLGITPGRYVQLSLALEEIDNSDYHQTTKDRMKLFLCEVCAHHRYGMDGAIAKFVSDFGLTTPAINRLLQHFEDINLNPATLPARSMCHQFPSIDDPIVRKNACVKNPHRHFYCDSVTAASKILPAHLQ